MCCCGNEHDNDPKYKCSRVMSCSTMTWDILKLVFLFALWIAVLLGTGLMCSVAKSTEQHARRLGMTVSLDTNVTEVKDIFSEAMKFEHPAMQFAATSLTHISGIWKSVKEDHLRATHPSHGRMLEADYNEIHKSAKSGCDAGSLYLALFWPNFIFCILGIVFYSIVACGGSCGQCCGGYQGSNKCVAFYSGIATVWELINLILLSSLAASLNNLKRSIEELGLADHPNVRPIYQFIVGVMTIVIIACLTTALAMVFKTLVSFFSFRASQEPHSGGQQGGNKNVQVIQMQQQPALTQSYVMQQQPVQVQGMQQQPGQVQVMQQQPIVAQQYVVQDPTVIKQ